MSVNYIYNGQDAENIGMDLKVDEDKCQVGIVCDTQGVGISSDGPFYAFVALINPHDTEETLIVCEDCNEWLKEVYR